MTRAARYFLLHDRKGVVTSFIGILAYLILLQFVVLHVGAALGWWDPTEPELFRDGSPWNALVWLNAGFFVFRAWSRLHFTTRLYGWRHGVMSVPRMVIGNFVNCMAVGRAWRMYLASVFFGRKLVWDKTAHEFPTGEQLARTRKKLGELLQTWQAVDAQHLAQALEQQAQEPRPLGQVLLSQGWVDEETLAEALAYQADLPRVPLPPELVQQHASGFPLELALRLRAVFIGQGQSGQPLLAVAAPLDPEATAQAAAHLGAAPVQRIVSDRELDAALQLLAQPAPVPHAHPDVAEVLAGGGELLRDMLEQALPAPGVRSAS